MLSLVRMGKLNADAADFFWLHTSMAEGLMVDAYIDECTS